MNPAEQDDIRPPDKTVQDQMLDDDRSDFDQQLDQAMYISLQELKRQRDEQTQYELNVLKQYEDETKRRTALFKECMFQLVRLSKFDADVREVMEIVEPIVDSYCHQFIESCELDTKTYEKIFGTISRVRNGHNAVALLENIVKKSD